MSGSGTPRLAWLGAGFGMWATGFLVLYGVVSLGCAAAWDVKVIGPISFLRLLLLGLTLLTLCASLYFTRVLARRHADQSRVRDTASFIRKVALDAAQAALFATMFTFSGVVALSMCDAGERPRAVSVSDECCSTGAPHFVSVFL